MTYHTEECDQGRDLSCIAHVHVKYVKDDESELVTLDKNGAIKLNGAPLKHVS